MTWVGQWLKSTIGSWLGAIIPEPEGSMRATLRGSSSVGAKLTYEETNEQQLGIYGNQHNQRRVHETNRQIMEVILRAAPHVFSNYYK